MYVVQYALPSNAAKGIDGSYVYYILQASSF